MEERCLVVFVVCDKMNIVMFKFFINYDMWDCFIIVKSDENIYVLWFIRSLNIVMFILLYVVEIVKCFFFIV